MPRRPEGRLKVFVFGAGKAGAGLARALRAAGVKATVRGARRGLPRVIDADIVVLAVRDRDSAPLAEKLRDAKVVPRRAVVVHVAGALDAEVLGALRGHCAGVAQMHPMISVRHATVDARPHAGKHAHPGRRARRCAGTTACATARDDPSHGAGSRPDRVSRRCRTGRQRRRPPFAPWAPSSSCGQA